MLKPARREARFPLDPHTPLADAAPHTVTVDGVTDLAGNPVLPATSTFETRVGP